MTTLYLCRHGDTAYSPTRRLAGRTDLPLTEAGEVTARRLGARLAGVSFARAWCSPLLRARRTAELAGFGERVEIDPRIREIDFGDYEGRSVDEIRVERPGWTYLNDGCPGGEGPAELGARCDAFLGDALAAPGTVVVFAHSVLIRVLAARYLGLPAARGAGFMLSPGAISILTFDPHGLSPAIQAWNDCAHLAPPAGA